MSEGTFDVDAAIAAREAPPARRKPGRKPGVKRVARAASRPPERAEERAPLRDPERAPERLVRKRKGNEFDQFFIDPGDVPAGMDWNWKRTETLGKDMEDFHQQGLHDNGWRPVDAAKHPQYSTKGHGAITRPGYVLMERPTYLSAEAHDEVKQAALGMERQKREELFLVDNQGGRGAVARANVARSFGPIDVPA